MATKRKFSPAQLAAQKTFGDMARARAKSAKKRAKNPATKTVARKAPARKRNPTLSHADVKQGFKLRRAPVRKSNPSHTTVVAPARYKVHRVTAGGDPGKLLGTFPTKPGAVEYAQAYARAHKCQVGIVGSR